MQTQKTVELSPTEVLIKNARLSYPSLFKPTKPANAPESQKPKYAASLLISKEDVQTVTAIKKAIFTAMSEKFGSDKAKWPKGYKNPLNDGDLKDKEEYAGCWYVNASSFDRPVVLDQKKAAVSEEDNTVYAGCYVNAYVNFYGYSNVSKGVGAGLNAVQKAKDGKPFSARKDATQLFDVVDDGFESKAEETEDYDL